MKQWIGLAFLAVGVACGASTPVIDPAPIAEAQAAEVVRLGAADAEKAAHERLSALEAMRAAKLLPQAQMAAQSIIASADLAALDVDGIDCLQWLAAQDVTFEVVTDYEAERPRRGRGTCTIEQPVRVDGAIGGVQFSEDDMLMSCELARSMVHMAEVLAEHDVVSVEVDDPYSCRTIRRRRLLSQHAHGNALDVATIHTASGQAFSIRDWERRDATPESEGGRLWYEIVHQLDREHVFNIILTPDYDRAHRGWLHLDLTPDQHILR